MFWFSDLLATVMPVLGYGAAGELGRSPAVDHMATIKLRKTAFILPAIACLLLVSGCSEDGPSTITLMVQNKTQSFAVCPSEGSVEVAYEGNLPNATNFPPGFMFCGLSLEGKPIFSSAQLLIPNRRQDFHVAVLVDGQRVLDNIYIRVIHELSGGTEFRLTRIQTINGKSYLGFTVHPCSESMCEDVTIQ
jgi:hypothetical protein